MWVHKPEEEVFLKKYLNSKQRMLEYGSGQSTIEFSQLVKTLVTIEHHREWAVRVMPHIPTNVSYLFVPPDIKWESRDGTLEEFGNYIKAPLMLGPFDVIFIDGRARVECARRVPEICKPDTLIFFHDFGPKFTYESTPYRQHYDEVLRWMEIVDSVYTMHLLKLK